MKNLLSKTLFISLLLSATIPSGVQAVTSAAELEKAVVMGQEITKLTALLIAKKGRNYFVARRVGIQAKIQAKRVSGKISSNLAKF